MPIEMPEPSKRELAAQAFRTRPACPECRSTDTGTEVREEWYCYSCGYQWMKVPHHPRKASN